MVRSFSMLCGIALSLMLCGHSMAGQRLEYPRTSPMVCMPNTCNYGYFPTTWRQWPGERQMSETNPRAVGATVIPTPEGQEYVPAPHAAPPHAPPAVPEQGVLPRETILPPEAPPAVPETPRQQSLPGLPAIEGGLPGLPVEPNSTMTPSPLDSHPASGLIESEKPKKKEEAKPQERSNPSGAWRIREERISESEHSSRYGTVVSLVGAQTMEPDNTAIQGVVSVESVGDVQPAAYAAAESAGQVELSDCQVVVPPIAYDGYCPVELIRNGTWKMGDLRWTVVYGGLIFRLSSPEARQAFLADPKAFAPAYEGHDPVLAVDRHLKTPGSVTYCATYEGRLYMFSSAATQSRFNEEPRRYAEEP